MREPFVMF